MAVQDILTRAFAGEEASANRQPQLSVGLPQAAPPPLPMPLPQPEEAPQGPNLAALAMTLLGQQGGNRNSSNSLNNFSPGEGGGHNAAMRIANWIENRPGDFEVSGLEGFQGTGQISSGHVENSQHYTGEAGDVNYLGGGRWNGENAALDWLYNKLNRRWGDYLTELIWQAPDHYDHLHYGTRAGG